MTAPALTVVVRARDEIEGIRRALESVRAQTVPAELLVVDSGSTDGTLEVAHELADRVLEIEPTDFSFGRALNVGAAAATAPLHAALSAHCHLPGPRWVERVTENFLDSRVGFVSGRRYGPRGEELAAPVQVDGDWLARHPTFAMSNHASAWRGELWREQPFDEVATASEDVVFAHDAVRRGWVGLIDPRLVVSSAHRQSAGGRAAYRRARLETAAMASRIAIPVWRDLWEAWWYQGWRPGDRLLSRRTVRRRAPAITGRLLGHHDAGKLVPFSSARRGQ